jgi:hypothetical protein
MSQQFALLSLIFMMSFVLVFDKSHWRRKVNEFVSANLLSEAEVARMQGIWRACQEQ